MKKKAIYIVFFAALVLGFYFAISYAVPGFVNPKIPPIGTVNPFSFTNQNGQQVTNNDIKGKVVAVEYFFTTCTGICPRMNKNLRKIYDEYKEEKDFLILSHTCDPEVDSAARLKRYADSLQVDTNKWVFVTGRKDSLYDMARHSYKIDDPANNLQNEKDDFLHTQFMAVVNKKGEVVGIYDGLKPSEMKEMGNKIEKLLKE